MSKLAVRIINCILSIFLATGLIFGSLTVPVLADTTKEKLEEAEKQKKESEGQLDAAQDQIENLENSKDYLEGSLSDLNSKMTDISSELEDLESRRLAALDAKKKAEEELQNASKDCADQYAALKARIRIMYERGNDNIFDAFLESGSFSAFLNRTEYIERVHDYDTQLLEKYKNLEADVQKKNEVLQSKIEELDQIQKETESKQDEIQEAIDDTKSSITSYAGAIDDAEVAALAIEQKIIAQNSTIAALKNKLKEEEELARKSQEMAKRSLSEVSFAGGDKELLGALIQCEAGGEPWAGKIAVGAVVMNRVMSGAFPNTISGVIYQSGQFEPVSSGRLAIRLSLGANEECLKAAEEAMNGTNNIGECLFFRTIVPGIQGTIIGHHVFYLYWTGKYSGYGTADETLETAKAPEESEDSGEEESSEEDTSSDEDEEEEDSSEEEEEEESSEDEEESSEDEEEE
ncbi:MAG: cell wall hydrolase [Lachnospiraceae bacterium]|nr:cell wall hydrolase [Lachnospiraceae bacterium]